LSASTPKKKRRKAIGTGPKRSPRTFLIIGVIAILAIVIVVGALFLNRQNPQATSATTSAFSYPGNKQIILYVNQGNALVDQSNYSALVSFAKSNHFNTIFFQIYRSGQLLFSQNQLSYFVNSAHLGNLSIFFALYFTGPAQQIPSSIYSLGENGISLDMSTLSSSEQNNLLSVLSQNYGNGLTAVTATNFTTNLRPNFLILETYNFPSDQEYIHRGIIASVEPLAVSDSQSYEQQFQYALNNSDGVMVFDYYGLLKRGF